MLSGPLNSIPILGVSLVDFVWIVVGLLAMFAALSVIVLSMTWLERKVLARLQRRLGPTRTGPMGLLQPIADAIKLILKEDIVPSSSEKLIFWAAPLIVVISAFMIWVTIPGTHAAVVKNLDLGLLYIIAFAVVGILPHSGGLGVCQQVRDPGWIESGSPTYQLRNSHNHGCGVNGHAGRFLGHP